MNKIKVLILTSGSTPSIGIIKSLSKQKEVPIYLVGADNDKYSAGSELCQEKLIVPSFENKKFINFLLDYCVKNKIQYIFPPVINNGIEILSNNRELFERKRIKIFMTSKLSLKNILDKRKMANFCIKQEINIPKTFFRIEDIRKKDFPLIIKPRFGTGSQSVWKLNDIKDLTYYSKKINKPVIQKYIEAPEYTVDILNTEDNKFIVAVPRLRIKVKNGQSVQARIVADDDIAEYSMRISKIFKINGPANIQLFKNGKTIYLIEINPKFGAGSILTFKNGVNMPLIYIKNDLGLKIRKSEINPKFGVILTRYWEELFLNDKT